MNEDRGRGGLRGVTGVNAGRVELHGGFVAGHSKRNRWFSALCQMRCAVALEFAPEGALCAAT